jgi:hypothetical protein
MHIYLWQAKLRSKRAGSIHAVRASHRAPPASMEIMAPTIIFRMG